MRYAKFGSIVGIILVVAATAFSAPHCVASTYEVLHRFKGPEGSSPQGGLIFDASGNLYGTTSNGGAHAKGTVFKLTPNASGSWTESVIHSFNGLDGWSPFRGSLIFDEAGNLYGTTELGGPSDIDSGVVFKLKPNANGSWTESVLHSFTGSGGDGDSPIGGLVFDGAGNLFGTSTGGASVHGVVFKLAPTTQGSWTESILHIYTGGHDGGDPEAALTFDSAGNLYGTASTGGSGRGGVVFKLSPELDGSWTETVLHNFSSGTGGRAPTSSLIFDQAGDLYGTTFAGGTQGFGVVFKLTPNGNGTWTEKVLHNFTGGFDGSGPIAGLALDAAGNLYGAATAGGSANFGVVFKLTVTANGNWTFRGLHAFQGTPGADPTAAPTLDGAGNVNVYGTTSQCGAVPACHGVVFKFAP